MRKTRINRKLKFLFWFFAIWVAIHATFITVQGLQDYEGTADVAVILGNRVYADGSLSPWLKGRADAALAFYRAKRVKKIFASGRISPQEDGGYPEGTAIKHYLVQQGIPGEDIIADNAGDNTFLTARNYQFWNQSHHYNSVIVVSQFFHITRAKYIFGKLGIQNVHHVASHDYTWRDIIGVLREVPAFYKYLIFY